MSAASPLSPAGPEPATATLERLQSLRGELSQAIARRVIGQQEVVELLLTALFAQGHALFVGAPGLAKTLLVRTLADALKLDFSRVQFTPDLMPADLIGSEVLDEDAEGRRSFRFVPGPIFCHLLLADEINRTPPKTQAALLEAMQESAVSAAGQTRPLGPPFHVLATRNPIEEEGTYPLPEAQLDRFMLEIEVGYPPEADERAIVAMGAREEARVESVLDPEELLRLQAFVRGVPVPESVVGELVRILRASRPRDPSCSPGVRELVEWGAGPRAGQQLLRAAQARAALRGCPAVEREDLIALAPAVLGHRIVPSFSARGRGLDGRAITRQLLESLS